MRRRTFLTTSAMATTAMLGTQAARGAVPEMRSATSTKGEFHADVLVCGGGPSGIGAATMAARLGAKVLLVERYGRLGGMAVQAIVGPLMGQVGGPPLLHEIITRVGGRTFDAAKLDLQYAELVQEAGAKLLLHAWAYQPLQKEKLVKGVRCVSKQGMIDIHADVIVDATGDGDIAFAAGADFEKGRDSDGLMQPMTIMYRIAGVGQNALLCSGERAAHKVRVPEGIWHDVVMKGRENGELAESIGIIRTYQGPMTGMQFINATQINHVDGTKVEDLTKAELEGRKQAYQVLDFLRKHAPGYENAYIDVMPSVVGVRETRRFLGVDYLEREDLIKGRKWPNAVVTGASFVIDIHNPDGVGQAEGFAERVKPYDIPYGCLIPQKIDGLLLAGRCISGSHEAHASYRVQCIAMATGVAAGAAAALSAQKGIMPRDVGVSEIQKALAKR